MLSTSALCRFIHKDVKTSSSASSVNSLYSKWYSPHYIDAYTSSDTTFQKPSNHLCVSYYTVHLECDCLFP